VDWGFSIQIYFRQLLSSLSLVFDNLNRFLDCNFLDGTLGSLCGGGGVATLVEKGWNGVSS